MNIQKHSKRELSTLKHFINEYQFFQQAMDIQDDYDHKHRGAELVVVKFYSYLLQLDSVKIKTLESYGIYDVKEEVEKIIEKWNYETDPVYI